MSRDNEMMGFRPPLQRGMQQLNRALFAKSFPLAAVRLDPAKITSIRKELNATREVLDLPRAPSVRADPEPALAERGGRCILLDQKVKVDKEETWSPTLSELVKAKEIGLIPYDLKLDYDYWNYHEVMSCILPEDLAEDFPQGFTQIGHIAHLNLRDEYKPFKDIIAQVILDKNHSIKTVINKIDDVGQASVYRTFNYELLAGKNDMHVEVHETDCVFRFDYSKVYYNTRLSTEHQRIVDLFQPGEAVCDVMAGVGPFAMPGGKKEAFVWANDLNPASYESMVAAVKENKVEQFVKPFRSDGRAFIRFAVLDLLREHQQNKSVKVPIKVKARPPPRTQRPTKTVPIPSTFSHFVLNLPASALTFLDAFIGLYHGQEHLFNATSGNDLPLVHVHCFSTKSDDYAPEREKITQEISKYLQHEMRIEDVQLYDVRDVAPNKRMFCATFRLPAEVAFRDVNDVPEWKELKVIKDVRPKVQRGFGDLDV